MISYMPQIYPDELVYSWFARYYVHSGHSAYVFALDDLFENRNMRPDVEFINRLDRNARAAITRTAPMERLVLGHTMSPYYRFIEKGRLRNALKVIADSGGDAHRLLPVQKKKVGEQNRHIRYCPLCAAKAREIYKELPSQGITELSQMQKIFTDYMWDFYEVCQIAFFLGIGTDELADPKLPARTQTEIFNNKVKQLYAQGLGCYRIARELGCSPSTVKNANKIKQPAEHDYSVRKGMQKENWAKMDEEMLPVVRDACEQIYHNNGGRPGRVTVYGVCRMVGLPGKRFDYLPKCRETIHRY